MIHPDSLVDISKDSRLSMTQDEADGWLKKLRECGVSDELGVCIENTGRNGYFREKCSPIQNVAFEQRSAIESQVPIPLHAPYICSPTIDYCPAASSPYGHTHSQSKAVICNVNKY
ncbi:hypothetical protein E2C01_096320 [Portunus trituberculatus]|uniref:Uncharacterized protein n=1 Tax=Portunus trituberculatus TaxID=210409 RepID=A0A5B7K1F4_PORTR|nr:hypothetical protein [Portunus trituberculatus]